MSAVPMHIPAALAQRTATLVRAVRCLAVSVGTTLLSAVVLVQFVVLDRVIFRDRAVISNP